MRRWSDRWRWSPGLRITARATLDDEEARQRRAAMRVRELHAALHLACEMSCASFDVDGYHRGLIDAVFADPLALSMLRSAPDDPGDDFEIIRIKLDSARPGWRYATAVLTPQPARDTT